MLIHILSRFVLSVTACPKQIVIIIIHMLEKNTLNDQTVIQAPRREFTKLQRIGRKWIVHVTPPWLYSPSWSVLRGFLSYTKGFYKTPH